jgi:hypothetical protein
VEGIVASLIAAPVLAFAVGAVARPPWRGRALFATLAAPLLVYTWWLVEAQPSEPGFWQWWAVGLLAAALPFLLSAGATLIGFKIGTILAPSADS